MEIKVLGPGCANCRRLEALVREVVVEMGAPADVSKVTDYREMMAYHILATPGLVVDGELKAAGRIPSKAEITTWVASALEQAQ